MNMIKVMNRSGGQALYHLPEFNTRRLFAQGETKEIEEKELEALWQAPGGREMIQDYLQVDNKDWIKQHWADVPVEYFWSPEQIKKSLLEDSLELFEETLVYAPAGVADIIKTYAWQIPLTDMNKMHAIKEAYGFDVQQAIQIMAEKVARKAPERKERLRRED